MLGIIIGIILGCLLFIPAITEMFNLNLPAWVPALAGLGFPLFFIISSIKQKQDNKMQIQQEKLTEERKKSFKDIDSGPGRGPNIKF